MRLFGKKSGGTFFGNLVRKGISAYTLGIVNLKAPQ